MYASFPLLALTVLGALAPAATAQRPKNSSGGELLPEEAAYDVRHYGLVLAVDPEERAIEGTLTLRADLVAESDQLIFDLADELELSAVRLNGTLVDFERGDAQRVSFSAEGLEVGTSFEVEVDYGGKPRRAPQPPWRGGFTWDKTKDGSPWIATTCQGEGADLWWPCKDHPSDEPDGMDLEITVPSPLVVASNGRLIETRKSGNEITYHWRVTTPISNYTVALNIAPYVTLTQDYESTGGETMPVTYWVLPENKAEGAKILPEFIEHLAFYEDVFGPYPFRGDKYGVVETPHLGMEHQSIIAYGNRYRGDPNFDYDWLHHHELAHEWWANLVTARDWNDFWIHEGIGTYCQALYLERKFGVAELNQKMELDRRQIANRGPVAPRGAKDTTWMYFGARGEASPAGDIYFKGSWICHSLRYLIGDEAFFRVLRKWAYPQEELEQTTDGSACRITTTDELLRIAERVSEHELEWFFEVYLRQPKLPELVTERADGVLKLAWRVPEGLDFPMPVDVQVGDRTVRVEMTDGRGELEIGEADYEIDPNRWLLIAR